MKKYEDLKKGDKLLCCEDGWLTLTRNKVYTIVETSHDTDSIQGYHPIFVVRFYDDNGKLGSIWKTDYEKGEFVFVEN